MAAALLTAAVSMARQDEPVMTKNGDVYVVNTTTLCDTEGFNGVTPLKVTFKGDKITKIEALPNEETPKFFNLILTGLLPKYKDLKMDQRSKVDSVTGATYSSIAVKANIDAACEYYIANK